MASFIVARRKSGNVQFVPRKYVLTRYTRDEDLIIIKSILEQGFVGNFKEMQEKLPHRSINSIWTRWSRIQHRFSALSYPLNEGEVKELKRIRGVIDVTEANDMGPSQITTRSKTRKVENVKENDLESSFETATESSFEGATMAIENSKLKRKLKKAKKETNELKEQLERSKKLKRKKTM